MTDSLTEEQMLERFRAMVREFGVRGASRQLGITPSWVDQVNRGRQSMTGRLAEKMGYRRVVRFEPLERHTHE